MNTNNPTTPSSIEDTILIDFRKLFGRMLSSWWLFVLCVGLALGAAHLYLRYTTSEYSSTAILLIKDAGESGNISAESILLSEELGGGKAMDNEIQILKSLTLMEKVVARLNLNIVYTRIGNLKETDLYKESPFVLDSVSLMNPDYGVSYFIELGDYETFLVKETEEDEGNRYQFGVPFANDKGSFVINISAVHAIVKGLYRLSILPVTSAAYKYRSRLTVERIGDQGASSVLQLSLMDQVPLKTSEIINTLIDVYNEEEIKDENKVLENTIDFIDHRVSSLVNELDSVEGGIQRYKSNNQIINDNASSSMNYTLSEIRTALQKISQLEIEKNQLNSIESFLSQNGAETVYDLIPANLAAQNQTISGMVNQYNNLVLQEKQLATTASKLNPTRQALGEQIITSKSLILQTIKNLQKDIQIPYQEIESNIQELKRSMSSIPGIEKKLIEKVRTQAIKEKLFLFLLQKREETALSEAVATAKTRTIDHARIPRFPVYPKPKLIRATAISIGLIVPILLILIGGLFRNKVDSEEIIQQYTSIPIIGRIAKNKGKENIVVKNGSRSAVNEMFRLLRTNLSFLNPNKDTQTIMMTSSVSGEGKTFIALNLGITLSLADKKVVLLGMDLRKPKLATYLNVPPGKGITNFLIGQNTLEEVIMPFKDHKNLSYITAGTTPPNPGELILSNRMSQLLTELKSQFDYIIIDTPPIGLVSDALLLRPYVDNILIVVRQKYTRKAMLKNLEEMYQKKELQKVSIIFNDIKRGKSYYGYGGYYYGNNQGYYVED